MIMLPKANRLIPVTDAYATVVHSFALAMAKELRCENDGGLEPRPVLDPV
ncbi:hypothetical protein ACWGQ9_06445 [Streptomyces parvus]